MQYCNIHTQTAILRIPEENHMLLQCAHRPSPCCEYTQNKWCWEYYENNDQKCHQKERKVFAFETGLGTTIEKYL